MWESQATTRVLVCGRRWGKTDLGSMWTLSEAKREDLEGIDGVRWIVTPTFKHARPIWRKIHRLAPKGWITGTLGTDSHPDTIRVGRQIIEFRAAVHPESLVAEGLRGVWLDECGILKRDVWEESILPTLVDFDAPALLSGSPKGRGWFYEWWRRGQIGKDRTEIESWRCPSWGNPFVSRRRLLELARRMPEHIRQQEIWAEFLLGGTGAIHGLDQCLRGEITPYIPGHDYVSGIDIARLEDWFVTLVYDRTAKRVAAMLREQRIPWRTMEARSARLVNAYRATAWVDATGVGDRVFDDLERRIERTCTPINFSTAQGRTKREITENMIHEVAMGEVSIPPALGDLVGELRDYDYTFNPVTRSIRYAAPEGLHDDCVTAFALALWGARAPAGPIYRPPVYEREAA